MTFRHNGQKYRLSFGIAIVATVSKDGGDKDERLLGSGIAFCHPTDVFNPAEGARLATTRALQESFQLGERTEIWHENGLETFRDKIEKAGEAAFARVVCESGFPLI